jgi:hypothetical protein
VTLVSQAGVLLLLYLVFIDVEKLLSAYVAANVSIEG